jgi:hypothetical protein
LQLLRRLRWLWGWLLLELELLGEVRGSRKEGVEGPWLNAPSLTDLTHHGISHHGHETLEKWVVKECSLGSLLGSNRSLLLLLLGSNRSLLLLLGSNRSLPLGRHIVHLITLLVMRQLFLSLGILLFRNN